MPAAAESNVKQLPSAGPSGLTLLRQPFPDHLVSVKPMGTKAQNGCPDSEKKDCEKCGGWHHPRVRHLDYVGHAALTDRLLDVDPDWNWDPVACDERGLPALDKDGGLWIKLTVCGVTRKGYGNAEQKEGRAAGDRIKECIGDAIRNAAMRFGAALEFWHKGDLHAKDDENGGVHGAGVQPEPKKVESGLPALDGEKFKKLLPDYRKLIDGGSKTADHIISNLETKYALTGEQKTAIRGAGAEDPR